MLSHFRLWQADLCRDDTYDYGKALSSTVPGAGRVATSSRTLCSISPATFSLRCNHSHQYIQKALRGRLGLAPCETVSRTSSPFRYSKTLTPMPDTSSSSLGRVPSEIWSRIFELVDDSVGTLDASLPYHGDVLDVKTPTVTHGERVFLRLQSLRKLPLVCRTWRAPATKALYRHVAVREDIGLALLTSTAEENTPLASLIKSISLLRRRTKAHGPQAATAAQQSEAAPHFEGASGCPIYKLLRQTTQVTRLDTLSKWAEFDYRILRSLPLVSLSLERKCGSDVLALPDDIWAYLPSSLRHLSLARWKLLHRVEPAQAGENTPLALQSLSFSHVQGQVSSKLLTLCKQVIALECEAVENVKAILAATAPTLESLSIRCGPEFGYSSDSSFHIEGEMLDSTNHVPSNPHASGCTVAANWITACVRLKRLSILGLPGFNDRAEWPVTLERLQWFGVSPYDSGLSRLLAILGQESGLPRLKSIPSLLPQGFGQAGLVLQMPAATGALAHIAYTTLRGRGLQLDIKGLERLDVDTSSLILREKARTWGETSAGSTGPSLASQSDSWSAFGASGSWS